MFNPQNGIKTLTVAQLMEALNTLDPTLRLAVNQVGNLLVLSADEQLSLGYIDFLFEGEINWFEDDFK